MVEEGGDYVIIVNPAVFNNLLTFAIPTALIVLLEKLSSSGPDNVDAPLALSIGGLLSFGLHGNIISAPYELKINLTRGFAAAKEAFSYGLVGSIGTFLWFKWRR